MTTIRRAIAFASLVLVAPTLFAQSQHQSGFAVSTEKVEGWNACAIVQSRDEIIHGWYKEGPPGSIPTKYWAKTKEDCRGLAEWIQGKRPEQVSKKLSFSQAGSSSGLRSAATYTQYQFDDGYLPFTDSSEKIYSRDVRAALAKADGRAHKRSTRYAGAKKAAGSQNVAFAQPK
jgi:hypothetical protein